MRLRFVITAYLLGGVHPRVVMEMLGHPTITLTMNVCSHIIPNLQGEANEDGGCSRLSPWLSTERDPIASRSRTCSPSA